MKLLVLVLFFMQGKPPQQPIPYSHKLHAGTLGLPCRNCHTSPDPGEMMGIPGTGVCMGCHESVKKDSPHIEKLAGFAKQSRPVPWVRVYQIPSFVFFSHKAHLAAGANCETCHGPVKEREALARETDISMGGCMACHQKHKASNDCEYCHEKR
ncbi:MAG TPA: cytochrome c3 family protein [Bryobacteraceae bacterium]|nr:cytochrome c3 family protein [Bryobacteraceae bacterium]